MKKTISFFFIVVFLTVALFCAGCTQFLQPAGYPPYSKQMKIQAAYYWNILARDVAFRINSELVERDYLAHPVMVSSGFKKGDNVLPFDKAFKDLLTTQLVSLGVPTIITPDDDEALQIEYRVQVVFHETGRYLVPRPNQVTSLAETVFATYNAGTAGGKNINLFDDDWNAFIINGHYEVIITTSVLDDNFYVFRDSSIYYINDLDNFIHRPPPEKKTPEKPLPAAAEVEMVSYPASDNWL